MSKQKSEYLSVLGKLKLFKGIVDDLKAAGGGDEEIAALGRKEVRGRVAGVLLEATKKATFPAWRTLTVNPNLRTADDFRRALTDKGFLISGWANDILDRANLTVPESVTELELVVLSNAKLGFPNGAIYGDTCRRILELGYDLCPPRAGPELRIQYSDQPLGEWLILAMEPVAALGDCLDAWRVERDSDGRWLRGAYGSPSDFWFGDDRFVFVRRK